MTPQETKKITPLQKRNKRIAIHLKRLEKVRQQLDLTLSHSGQEAYRGQFNDASAFIISSKALLTKAIEKLEQEIKLNINLDGI